MQARRTAHDHAAERRARTRQLIELGGLVQKAGLADLAGDDRATLLGAFRMLAAQWRSEDRERLATLWRREGGRDADDA